MRFTVAGILILGLTVLPCQAVEIALTGYELLDNGDGDGIADDLETVQVRLRVKNVDQDVSMPTYHNVRAWLQTAAGANTCVTRASLLVGTLAPSEELWTTDTFAFQVADLQRSGFCTVGGNACTDDLACVAGGGDRCDAIWADLSLELSVRFTSDESPELSDPTSFALDLDLDLSGGSGPTTWFEGFEGGTLGSLEPLNLDFGLHDLVAADGYRCQYNDPDEPLSNSYQTPNCFPGGTPADADAFHWHTDGPTTPAGGRAYSGNHSLHLGVDLASDFTTPTATLEAVGTSTPIALGWSPVCSDTRTTSCSGDGDCPPGQFCEPASPTLAIKHQVRFMDERSTGAIGGERGADRGVVQIQRVDSDPAGSPVGDWEKLYPLTNVYDRQAAEFFSNCSFDPIDDGTTEDDLFVPPVPGQHRGPSSTCYPEFSFVAMGSTAGPFDPLDLESADGPGLAGSVGVGTWVESTFDLSPFRGQRVRLRLLTSSLKVGPPVTWEAAITFNPDPADDGWWIDDVTVSDTLMTAATRSTDVNDNSGLPPFPTSDGDTDGAPDACDNCIVDANADQADTDGDLVGDACDACPLDFLDDSADGDGVCPSQDNCPDLFNPSQADGDFDGIGDLCDPVHANPFVVSSDPADGATYATIGEAIDAATVPHTPITVLPGNGYSGEHRIQGDLPLIIEGVAPSGAYPLVSGPGLTVVVPTFNIMGSSASERIVLRGLDIEGIQGIRSLAPVLIENVRFVSGTATPGFSIDLHAPGNLLREVRHEADDLGPVLIGPGADTRIERSLLRDRVTTSAPLELSNTVIANDRIEALAGATLDIRHSTLVSWGGPAIDGSAACTGVPCVMPATIESSIVIDDNAAGDATVAIDCADISWSTVHPGPDCSAVNDNLNLPASFLSPGNGLYILFPGSPLIDYGPPAAQYDGIPCLDLYGGLRLRDGDGDGIADLDPGAAESVLVAGRPAPVTGLIWTALDTLEWPPVSGAVEYHPYRGDLAALAYDHFGSCRDDLDGNRTDTVLVDGELPTPGAGYFYLIGSENSSGTPGRPGDGSCAEQSLFDLCP